MITKKEALALRPGQYLSQTHMEVHHPIGNSYSKQVEYGSLAPPKKWRVNGQCQTWVTRPNDFRIPLKHGLYTYGELTHENCHLFSLEV